MERTLASTWTGAVGSFVVAAVGTPLVLELLGRSFNGTAPIVAGLAATGVISGAFGVAGRCRLASLLLSSAGVCVGMWAVLASFGGTIARPSDLVWIVCIDAILVAPMLAGFALVVSVAYVLRWVPAASE